MESHMIKLLPNKEFVVEILEEIIEYKEEDKTVLNYLVLIEQAQRDLKDIVKIWKFKESSISE
jgi:serine/threonine protein kinase